MVYAHHPHLLSHKWFELHPELLARLIKYGLPLGVGAVLAGTALFIGDAASELDVPLEGAAVVTVVAGEPFVPTGITGYLPPQFYEQEKQPSVEELSPPF